MAYEVEVEIKYESRDELMGEWSTRVFSERIPLKDEAPEGMLYLDYRKMAAMQVLDSFRGENVIVPTNDDKTEYRVIPKGDIIYIKSRTLKTLDKE